MATQTKNGIGRGAAAANQRKPEILARSKGASKSEAGHENGSAPGENLEKVRDLLFGAQMRDHDTRFVRLEERLAREAAELREESRKRLESLEGFIKKEFQSLLERLKSEQSERTDGLKAAAAELKEFSKSMDKRVTQLDERSTVGQSALRQELLEQSKTLRDEVRQSHDAATASLDSVAAELRLGKTDRAALAEIFGEMAMRLSGEAEKKGAKK